MKSAIRRIAALAAATTTVAMGTLSATLSSAAQFGQKDVDQSKFVAVAAPFRGGNAHQLLIIEQVSASRPCWSEINGAPTKIDPLLTTFDFTGICSRSTDSNGYSIRMNGQDLGLQYSLRIVDRNGDMLLIGAPRDPSKQSIVIGHTNGETNEFAKISLNPGWRFTKRTYNDSVLGHVYLTYEGDASAVAMLPASGGSSTPTPTTPPVVTPPAPTPVASPFRDTNNNIYATEIAQAVQTGFISGFYEDNTFRPQAPLTREQLVSMVIGALSKLPNARLNVPNQAAGNPYSDVEASRWSAAKIQFARDNKIVSGYEDGTFRPAQAVTRAELMAVLERAAEYGRTLQGQSAALQGNRTATNFADINGHWASKLIGQMSTYCGVASPVNESGSSFAPDSPAQRDYAAAATLRTLNCLKGGQQTAAK